MGKASRSPGLRVAGSPLGASCALVAAERGGVGATSLGSMASANELADPAYIGRSAVPILWLSGVFPALP